MKTCSRCGEVKPLDAFYRRKRSRDGRYAECKPCAKKRDRARYAASERRKQQQAGNWKKRNPALVNAAAKRRRDADPDRAQAVQNAWRAKNRERVRATARERYQRHRLAAIARARRWQQANPERHAARESARRARLLGALDTNFPNAEVAAYCAYLRTLPCVYCGSRERIEIDHIVALTKGGCHTPSNLAPACKRCNTSKGNRGLDEWLRR